MPTPAPPPPLLPHPPAPTLWTHCSSPPPPPKHHHPALHPPTYLCRYCWNRPDSCPSSSSASARKAGRTICTTATRGVAGALGRVSVCVSARECGSQQPAGGLGGGAQRACVAREAADERLPEQVRSNSGTGAAGQQADAAGSAWQPARQTALARPASSPAASRGGAPGGLAPRAASPPGLWCQCRRRGDQG
jgi:hypothetical protein